MAQPYVGEIRIFAGNFAPLGWEFCHGQTLSIMENETLFQLIGTTYGGDGETTFALPDLRGRSPLHPGIGPRNSYILAESGGTEVEYLTVQQIPSHSHAPFASTDAATSANPASGVWAPYGDLPYGSDAPGTVLHPETVVPTGNAQPHENMPPFLALNFIISLFGIFPSQT
ncbi:tail fiber protein [Salinibacterium sp. SYSU T00001]|uniref:phage tail protein n=1 Tax=Homoserinimonas sedimenticola TaxID=2986805 RepID=UPI002235F7B2|nr:tail fiber protein [Salinibacterium sedimenticola]MCW4385529.1 tail fiber protein [Salinibacterium sedimenticola]